MFCGSGVEGGSPVRWPVAAGSVLGDGPDRDGAPPAAVDGARLLLRDVVHVVYRDDFGRRCGARRRSDVHVHVVIDDSAVLVPDDDRCDLHIDRGLAVEHELRVELIVEVDVHQPVDEVVHERGRRVGCRPVGELVAPQPRADALVGGEGVQGAGAPVRRRLGGELGLGKRDGEDVDDGRGGGGLGLLRRILHGVLSCFCPVLGVLLNS